MNEEPTPEVLAHLLKVQPMRQLSSLLCAGCGYEWVQPAATGNCPKCHRAAQPVGRPRVSALRVV